MRKMVVNHFLLEKPITVQNKLHCVFTNEYKWTFERGRIALRVLWKRYHFEWGRFHVLVEWIPFKCQNMHSNLDFVSFSYFLWPDFVVALWLALFTPAWWCQVTGRYLVEERIFSIVLDLSFLSALKGWGGGGLHNSPVGLAWTLLLDQKVFRCFDQLFLPVMHIWCLLPVLICPHWNQIMIMNMFYHKLQLCKDTLQRMIIFCLLKEKHSSF